MKCVEISNDTSNPIVAKRIELETMRDRAMSQLDRANWELSRLQEGCRHEHAVLKPGWQGGGIYYCYCTCPECGRSGSRYVPQYHMKMINEWYTNPAQHITLEEAIKLGKRIGDSFMDNKYWWGEIEDFEKHKDPNEDWR
jgi:hypothetical protein